MEKGREIRGKGSQLRLKIFANQAEKIPAVVFKLHLKLRRHPKVGKAASEVRVKREKAAKVVKKRGPPFGHPAYQRPIFPEELVKERIVVKEEFCRDCGGCLQTLADPPLVHQQAEIYCTPLKKKLGLGV